MPARDALVRRIVRMLTVWLAVYPSVLLVLWLVGDRLRQWPLPLRVAASTALVVPVVVNIAEPVVRTLIVLGRRMLSNNRGTTP